MCIRDRIEREVRESGKGDGWRDEIGTREEKMMTAYNSEERGIDARGYRHVVFIVVIGHIVC